MTRSIGTAATHNSVTSLPRMVRGAGKIEKNFIGLTGAPLWAILL
jgi:hypothetical protein